VQVLFKLERSGEGHEILLSDIGRVRSDGSCASAPGSRRMALAAGIRPVFESPADHTRAATAQLVRLGLAAADVRAAYARMNVQMPFDGWTSKMFLEVLALTRALARGLTPHAAVLPAVRVRLHRVADQAGRQVRLLSDGVLPVL
jgi:hypothetical protein